MPAILRLGIDYSVEAEQSVLGSMLMDNRCVPAVMTELTEEDFCGEENRAIFWAVKSLFLRNRYIDIISVLDEMRRAKSFDEENTRPYILHLADITPTAANVMEYVAIVRKKTIMRRAHDAAEAILLAREPEAVQAAIESVADALANNQKRDAVSLQELLKDTIDWLNDPAPVECLPTGIRQLDDEICVQRTWVTIIAGFPGDGKTLFSLQAACNMAKKYRVGYFFFESSKEDTGKRLLSLLSGVSYRSIVRKNPARGDFSNLIGAYNDSAEIGLDVVQASGYTTAKIRALTAARHYDAVFVDYLQIVQRDDWRLNETQAVAKASSELRQMAVDLNCAVFALSQFHRMNDQRGHPTKYDLKSSSSLEQDAAIILLLSTAGQEQWEIDKAGFRADRVPTGKKAKLLQIAKNRNGEEGGRMYLLMDGAKQRFDYWNPKLPPAKQPPQYEQQRMVELPDSVPYPFD